LTDLVQLSMQEWFGGIIRRMFELVHRIEPDNFDARRYRGIPADAFFVDQHARYLLFLEEHRAEFFAARSLLIDETSRTLFDQLVLFRLLGHLHVRLPFNTPAARNFEAVTSAWKVEDTPDVGMFGPLSIFAVPIDDDVLCFKCWDGNVAANVIFHHYYFDRAGIAIAPTHGDWVLDVGGCFGDTALTFARSVGPSGHVYTFDPMPKHCAIMRETFAMNPTFAERITLFEFGLSDVSNAGGASAPQHIDPGARLSEDLPTRTLDSLELPRIDFIKMDIEGAELMALKGGNQSLRRWKPKLAISLYHRPEDFFTIPLWLESMDLGYRFFLEHYSIHHEETILYAVAP
jgi:FkbM family methyltransferase